MNNLQGKNIWIEKDESENTYLYYEALIEAGYSELCINGGFIFRYLVSDAGYDLINVNFVSY